MLKKAWQPFRKNVNLFGKIDNLLRDNIQHANHQPSKMNYRAASGVELNRVRLWRIKQNCSTKVN
jgi:hypothetical protein